MKSLKIWRDFNEFQDIQILESHTVLEFCLTREWILITTSVEGQLIYFKNQESIPKVLNFSENVCFLSCNSTIAFLLTSNGWIWVLGEDANKSGLFGQENVYQSNFPIKMNNFSQNKIISLSLSEFHAAAVCIEGLLYTWGVGKYGELCSDIFSSSSPQLVSSSSIFCISQVICGDQYTAICTKAGYLYIYGNNHNLKTEGNYSSPYTFDYLEDYYIEKVYDSNFGILLITDEGKCFILETIDTLTRLPASRRIESIAKCSIGVAGLTLNKDKIYFWTKQNTKWHTKLLQLNTGCIEKIASGHSNELCLLTNKFDLSQSTITEVNELLDSTFSIKAMNKDREVFQEIYRKYDRSIKIHPGNFYKLGFKQLAKAINITKLQIFKRIHNFSEIMSIIKKVYIK